MVAWYWLPVVIVGTVLGDLVLLFLAWAVADRAGRSGPMTRERLAEILADPDSEDAVDVRTILLHLWNGAAKFGKIIPSYLPDNQSLTFHYADRHTPGCLSVGDCRRAAAREV